MTRDEQRLAWRVYAAAALVALDVTKDGFGEICDVAEEMLNREMERFDGPDHSGDANKMVEPSIDGARDLLAVVEEAIERYGKPGGPWNVPSDPGGWMDRAQAAVAKARGTMSSMTSKRSEGG